MNKRLSIGAVIALMAVTATITVSITYTVAMNIFDSRVYSVMERQVMYEKISEIDQKIRQNYMGTIDEKTLRNALANGYLDGLDDPYSRYLSPEEYRAEQEAEKGEIYGLGLDVERTDEGNIRVYSVTPNSPAEGAGIKKGDIIVKVAGKRVTAVGYEKALAEMTSTETPVISITTSLNGTESTRDIQKAKYSSVTVQYSYSDRIGYILIKEFNSTTTQQFDTALNSLIKAGAEAFIFDVRGNAGGQITPVCEILDRLVPAGTILSSVDRLGNTKVEYTSDANQISYPCAVLVNEDTSSGAELFAATLRDFQKAQIVGVTTFGKGTMQKTFPLNDGSAVSLTVAKILPASGKSFDESGIKPDFEVKSSLPGTNFLLLSAEEDNQLQTARDVVSQQLGEATEEPAEESEPAAE